MRSQSLPARSGTTLRGAQIDRDAGISEQSQATAGLLEFDAETDLGEAEVAGQPEFQTATAKSATSPRAPLGLAKKRQDVLQHEEPGGDLA